MQVQQLGSPVCLPMESLPWLLCCSLIGKSAELKAMHLPIKHASEGQDRGPNRKIGCTRSEQIERTLWTQSSMLSDLQYSEARLQGTVLAPTSQPARSPIPGRSSDDSRNIDMVAAHTCTFVGIPKILSAAFNPRWRAKSYLRYACTSGCITTRSSCYITPAKVDYYTHDQ